MAPINLSSNTTTMAIYTIDFYGIDVTTSRCSFDITTQFIDAEEQQRNNKTTVSVKNLQYAVEFGNDEINDDDPTYL
ncbi:MAG: hypothetical protein MJ233_00025 [Mycoplasmoidaceae bacterium]|nr:hypothetical protein [Mycoplasmoidaceae bacterium]